MKLFAALALLLPALIPLQAQVTVQNFEGFGDNTALTTQISGLTFTGASVYTSGISLNNAQYPPRSGVNVVTNTATNSITITFATPVPAVNGYYTYSGALTVQAFNTSSALVASATSAFSNNTALSGAAGGSPNELIAVSSSGGIASITITSTAGINSFTLDDLTYGNIVTSVPTVSLPAMGGLVFLLALAGCLAAGRQARAGGMAALMFLLLAGSPRPAHANIAGAAAVLTATPQFGLPFNVPTSVTFTCNIFGVQALANTVTLTRVDTTPPTLVGAMTLTGGSTYSLVGTVTANPSQTFQCTVGNGLSTLRAKSPSVLVSAIS